MKNIAIIPARGGSKGIPHKNIKKLCGIPLIEYTIKCALSSKVFEKVIVSTDDKRIMKVVENYKDILIINRPENLARDDSPTELSLIHACQFLIEKEKYFPDVVFTLEPTSPLRTEKTIIDCSKLINNSDYDSIVGVIETSDCLGKIKNNSFNLLNENEARQRQLRNKVYKISSTIYVTRYSTLIRTKDVLGGNTAPYIVNDHESVDINNEFDFLVAEILMKEKSRNNG